jgi:hypothetical protein
VGRQHFFFADWNISMRGLTCFLALILLGSSCRKSEPQLASNSDDPPPKNTITPDSNRPDRDPFENSSKVKSDGISRKDFDQLIDLIQSIPSDDTLQRPAPFDPPLTDADINRVLQQCVQHVLLDQDLQHSREFYGTVGSTEVILEKNSPVGLRWPSGFEPEVKGWSIRFNETVEVHYDKNRLLGIPLDKLDVESPYDGIFNGNIALTLSNAGGSKNGMVIGGCRVFFRIQREGETYVAKYAGHLDP